MAEAQTFITSGNCKAQFKYEVNDKLMSPMAATAISFYDASEGNITGWFWDFGDGNTSQEQNPLHIYLRTSEADGNINPYKTVSLTILTSDTCKSFYAETIQIFDDSLVLNPPACKAAFKYCQSGLDTVNEKATIQFTNLSEGQELSYFWQIDGIQTSTEKEPSLTFDLSQKEHKVCLTVKGSDDCSDSFCDAVYVSYPTDTVIYPDECKAYYKYSVNHSVQTFAPALVLDFFGVAFPEAIDWKWDFGDGTTSTDQNPTHIFNFPLVIDNVLADPNPFRNVCLKITTASGCIAEWCETINIYMQSTPQCHAWFKYYRDSTAITIPEVIPYHLIDVSEGDVTSRIWKFEDGSTSTEAEPRVSFDFQKPKQNVCLTISTSDGCTSTWCETIFVTDIKPDTIINSGTADVYAMRYISSFPIWMSSCAGYVKAQVYRNDTIIDADNYVWSTGAEGQEIKGLCPTRIYTVKATTVDGTVVSGTFKFNSDGTVTEAPYNWWVSGVKDNPLLLNDLYNNDYTTEWELCDGTIVRSDSIPQNSKNCGDEDATMILKDGAGNIVYTKTVSMKALVTNVKPQLTESSIRLFPNPVEDVLNLKYLGKHLSEMKAEIFDIAGKKISTRILFDVHSGENISLNVLALKKGIYLCKITSGKDLISLEKFVK